MIRRQFESAEAALLFGSAFMRVLPVMQFDGKPDGADHA